MENSSTLTYFLISKDIPYKDIDDFIAIAFHSGKVMTPSEYEEYHRQGLDKDEVVELCDLYDKCYEWCPECEVEVELDTKFEMQICPNCGMPIAPCNLCGGRCCSPCPLGCR